MTKTPVKELDTEACATVGLAIVVELEFIMGKPLVHLMEHENRLGEAAIKAFKTFQEGQDDPTN